MTLDQLLHDAEHADSGARMAAMMRDTAAFEEFQNKRNALLARALEMDPSMESGEWEEMYPEVRKVAETLREIAQATRGPQP